jgi:hypothetical protein
MLRKTLVLAIALAASAMLSLPSAASAEWLHHETPINEDAELGLTGSTRFQGSLGGVECQVTSTVLLTAGQTNGSMETVVPHPTSETSNCKGLGGLAFCQVHDLTPQAPKWPLHKTTAIKFLKISITWGNPIVIQKLAGGFCPAKKITLTPTLAIATSAEESTVSSFELSGETQAHIETTSGATDSQAVQLGGTLNIETPNADTYS